MKKTTKRILAFLAAAAMALSLAGCTQSGENAGDNAVSGGDGKLFSEPTTVSIMLTQGNALFQNDWKVWEYIREATGVNLDLQLVISDISTKMTMAFASKETIPDLVIYDYKPAVDQYASQGALIAIEDVEQYMPNYKAFWEKADPEKKEAALKVRRSADGKTYWPARSGIEEVCGLNSWFYRKDIFDKHGLEIPKTYEEMYETAKKLKELYPESYPLGIENFFTKYMALAGPQWKPNFEHGAYYDFANEKWCYGGIEDTMLDVIKAFKRFYDEGLIVPSFISMDMRSFNELVTTGKVFMFPHAKDRFALYSTTIKEISPEYELAPMTPPVANTETGLAKMNNYSADLLGLAIANSGDEKRIANAAKLLDWFYTDEAIELMSWGKEGETYEVVDGKKKFILGENEDISSKYGFQTYAAGQVFDPLAAKEAVIANVREEDLDLMISSIADGYNPAKWMSFTDEEMGVRADKGTAIDNYAQEMISKFITGLEPLSKWDSYVETIKEMGLDELLAAYESAYNRVK